MKASWIKSAMPQKKAYSVDGKVYAMGVSTWTNAWVYNKDLLKKVGYDSIPATWDEFLTMCGKLKAAGITPYLEPKDGLGNAVEAGSALNPPSRARRSTPRSTPVRTRSRTCMASTTANGTS